MVVLEVAADTVIAEYSLPVGAAAAMMAGRESPVRSPWKHPAVIVSMKMVVCQVIFYEIVVKTVKDNTII